MFDYFCKVHDKKIDKDILNEVVQDVFDTFEDDNPFVKKVLVDFIVDGMVRIEHVLDLVNVPNNDELIFVYDDVADSANVVGNIYRVFKVV